MKKIILTILIIPLCYVQAIAQAGSLNSSFGNNGIALTQTTRSVGSSARAVKTMMTQDGKILVVTDMFSSCRVDRLNANGSIDNSFGTEGQSASFPFQAYSGLLQPDGKIIIIGNTVGNNYDCAIARLNANGSPDVTFDNDGMALVDFGSQYDYGIKCALQNDGKLVVVGAKFNDPHFDFAITRLTVNGIPDVTFDGDGKLTLDFFNGWDIASDVAIQADGKIVVAGVAIEPYVGQTFALLRLNVNGSLDESFAGDGKLTESGAGDYWNAVAIQPDGKILLTGGSYNNQSSDAFLFRFNENGTRDISFDTDGLAVTDMGGTDYIRTIIIQGDGKIVIAGKSYYNQNTVPDISVIRYNTNGSLDNSFDGDGKLSIDFASTSYEDALSLDQQTDGKIIVAGASFINDIGERVIIRLNTNGSYDNSFDGDGKLIFPLYIKIGLPTTFNSIAKQTDGKLIAGGYTVYSNSPLNYNFILARYNLDGTLDNNFDGDGILTLDLGSNFEYMYDLAVQEDGKILAGGFRRHPTTDKNQVALARMNPDGTLDGSFGSGGILIFDFSANNNSILTSLALQPDGKILIAGNGVNTVTVSTDFAIARLNPDGTFDNSFNGNGKVFVDFPENKPDGCTKILLQPDGKIIASGYTLPNPAVNEYDFAVARINSDGSLDPSFGTGGKNTKSISVYDFAASAVLQPDGKIILAGASGLPPDYVTDFALVRFNADGTLDESFGSGGFVTTNNDDDNLYDVAIQADGKIIGIGSIGNQITSDYDFAIARYNSNGSLDNSFGNGGISITNRLGIQFASKGVIYNSKLFISGRNDSPDGAYGMVASYNLLGIQLSCPANAVATTALDKCTVSVYDINPIFTPSESTPVVNYTLTGATTGSGTGSISGMQFNTGITNITYTIAGVPSQTCSFTVTVNSYTLLGIQGVKLQQNNTVVNGSVGVTSLSGTAAMKKNVTINGPGAFLKAQSISLQAPYTIPTIIYAPASVALPTMQYNTTSTSGLSNVTVPNSTTVTITGNRKNVTIGTNCNVTLTGNIFGAITIGSGSSALFTQSSIDVTAITMNAGTVSANTQLKFSSDAIVRCAGSTMVNTRCDVNPDNHKVVMYLGKTSGAPVAFAVAAGGNETVNASMYIPFGKISVGGDATNMTYMNGKFIAENIETLDKNVIWNWYDCTPTAAAPLITSKTNNENKEQPVKPVTTLTIKAWPNPSEHQFTLNIESNNNESIELRVYDMYGRMVYSATGSANRQYQFGNRFVSGAYVAEVRQGVNRYTVKLIKQ